MTTSTREPTRVLVLNSCINAGGAGRSLHALLAVADPRLRAVVAMPAPGVLAARLSGLAEVVLVPEFVERMSRSPYRSLQRLQFPWLHAVANVFGLYRSIARLTELARESRAQVIYCNHMLAKPVGAAVGARTGLPVVFHSRACHATWIDAAFYGWLGRRHCVRRIICNSEAAAVAYRRHSDPKVSIVSNGLDLAEFSRAAIPGDARAGLGIAPAAFVVGFAGRIHARKGLDWLLRAFAAFARQRADAWLVVVGGNDSSLHGDAIAAYRTLAASLGIAAKTVFTGFQEDVRPLVAMFDVMVMPSVLPESFGRVLLEAMAFEVPVVISAHGGATEVARHEQEGLWVPVNDVEALARALARLYDEPALRRQFGLAGRRRVEACYDHVATAHRIVDELVATADRSLECQPGDCAHAGGSNA